MIERVMRNRLKFLEDGLWALKRSNDLNDTGVRNLIDDMVDQLAALEEEVEELLESKVVVAKHIDTVNM